MTKEEIRELIADMRATGLDVELCDTPVPVSVAGVPCGSPADEGFDGGGEGNTDAREDNIDNYRGSIWDNAW